MKDKEIQVSTIGDALNEKDTEILDLKTTIQNLEQTIRQMELSTDNCKYMISQLEKAKETLNQEYLSCSEELTSLKASLQTPKPQNPKTPKPQIRLLK